MTRTQQSKIILGENTKSFAMKHWL